MSAETTFLTAIGAYLGASTLAPVPRSIGIAEPENAAGLPAVVLWLEQTSRAGSGLGEKSELITNGALPVPVTIDLANPVLASDPTFRLLSANRQVLILPHGGQVRSDGTEGPLTGADLHVTVAGTARTVVTAPPVGTQVQGDPVLGQLTFGAPLPATGIVAVSYFLSQWERRTSRVGGILDVDVFGADAATTTSLIQGVVDALVLPSVRTDIHGLETLGPISLSSIGQKANAARKCSARFAFVYEQEINQPDSSGGIIRQIPVTTDLSVGSVDAAGAVQTTVVTIAG